MSLRDFVDPLPLASYVAWLGVYISITGALGLTGAGFGWPAHAMLWGFLFAWLGHFYSECRHPPLACDLWLAIQVGTALGLLMLGPAGFGPILLILVATRVAVSYKSATSIALLLLINVTFALILFSVWNMSWNGVFVTTISFGAFQAFAALTVHYAYKSDQMAEELQEVNAHLMATRSLLEEAARDHERLRLSRELHDVAGHKLTALKLNLRNLARREQLRDCHELITATSLAGELLDDLRAVVRQLRKDDGIDLASGIRRLIEPLPSPRLELKIDENVRVPRADQAETLLRVVQEGLTNAARHGRARNAWLEFGRRDQDFWLQLEDDGELQWPVRPGNGLTGMKERLEDMGGSLELSPSGRGGLRLTAYLPVELPA